MKKKIIICCNNAEEAAYVKKETDKINLDSKKKIESFVANAPTLSRLKDFLDDKLSERTTDDSDFKACFTYALNKLLTEGEYEPDKIVVGRIKKEFASIRAKDHNTIVAKTKDLIKKHELIYQEDEASKVYDIFKINTVTNYDELKQRIADIDGLVVPCELTWNHEGTGFNASDYKGISLVQYLRSQKNCISIPIVFTSFDDKKDIIKSKKDAEIIRTPALQHRFINIMQVNDLWDSVLTTFKEMRKLNDAELKYTQLQYCDLEGMLKQIKHAIRSNPKNREHYKKQIEYILAKDFSNNESLLEEYRRSEDLEAFCLHLINIYENKTDVVEDNNEFICKNGESPISILYLEDNVKDENADRFIKFIEKQQSENNNYRFKIKQIDNPDECYKKYNKFDVIIADIEILNKDEELIARGSEVVKKLIKEGAKKLFYIVTNVTRSFYDEIKIPGINRIRLKQEVFGSDEKIATFLYGIKEAIDHRQDDETKYKRVFDKLYAYINNSDNYNPVITYKFKKCPKESANSYFDLENAIKVKTLELVKKFLSLCYDNQESFVPNETGDVFNAYDNVCFVMKDYVSESVGKGESKLTKKVTQQDNNNETIKTEDNIKEFINRLVLRRFFVYIREFVIHYGIKSDGDEYHDADSTYITVSDLACRAINGAKGSYKKYNKEGNISTPNQSKCLSGALMLSEKEEEMYELLDKEERAFIAAIKEQKDTIFDFTSEDKIQNLTIVY